MEKFDPVATLKIMKGEGREKKNNIKHMIWFYSLQKSSPELVTHKSIDDIPDMKIEIPDKPQKTHDNCCLI